MNLTNVLGLLGTVVVLQLVGSLQLDFVTCVVFLIISEHGEINNCEYRVRLIPVNPMQTLNDDQFKKEFRFHKHDIPRLLQCLQWP